MIDPIIQNLIDILSSYSGITKKGATKIAYELINRSIEDAANLIKAIEKIKNYIFICELCHNITNENICVICEDRNRLNDTVMVVEHINDIQKFESTKIYDGRYLVWDSVPLKKDNKVLLSNVDLNYLKKFNKIIIALSPNLQGEVKTNYLRKLLPDKEISKLAIGLPFGSQIDYIDEITLKQAFNNRKEVKK